MSSNHKTVFVGMSGGVDSSVAALLLKKKGYNVVGVFMRCWSDDGPSTQLGASCAERDAEDARRVAEHIGIPFYVWDFEEEYKKRVVEYMIEGYRAGITPNPDVMCNREIKFGLFLKKALAMGADYVATGHYVRIKNRELYEAKDKNKDQSYFLWTLTQNELKHCLFPIGDYIKPEVRKMAAKAGLPTAAKKDSQGICFLGDVNVEEFLRARIKTKPGALVTTTGEVIGTHHGAALYTIGERHINAEFKFPKTAGKRIDRKPFYVADKNIKTNTVVVAEGSENEALYKKEIKLMNVNFIPDSGFPIPDSGLSVLARVRYRQPLAMAILFRISNLESRISKIKLIFDVPQKFIAIGQSAVFYNKKGEMLGGGIII